MTELGKPARERLDRLGKAVHKVERVLFRLARQGLDRASPATVVEVEALAQEAHLAGMVKVERELTSLAANLTARLERDPNLRETRLLGRVGRVWAFTAEARAAFQRGTDPREEKDALGEARRAYALWEKPVGVQTLGAAGWVADSGFMGVTLHLAGPDGLFTLAAARPTDVFGQDPGRLYRTYPHEAVDQTLEDLAHGSWILENAKVSGDGRLSLHGGLRVHEAPFNQHAWDGRVANTWREAVDLLRRHDPLLAEGALLQVRPSAWGPMKIDETASLASVSLLDGSGARLDVRVPLKAHNNLLIDNLQTLQRRADLRPDGVFGRVTASPAGLRLDPLTAVYDQPVTLQRRRNRIVDEVHLTLEDLERVAR